MGNYMKMYKIMLATAMIMQSWCCIGMNWDKQIIPGHDNYQKNIETFVERLRKEESEQPITFCSPIALEFALYFPSTRSSLTDEARDALKPFKKPSSSEKSIPEQIIPATTAETVFCQYERSEMVKNYVLMAGGEAKIAEKAMSTHQYLSKRPQASNRKKGPYLHTKTGILIMPLEAGFTCAYSVNKNRLAIVDLAYKSSIEFHNRLNELVTDPSLIPDKILAS
jgi:hypothetical protein